LDRCSQLRRGTFCSFEIGRFLLSRFVRPRI
jgi:hypothetical protein